MLPQAEAESLLHRAGKRLGLEAGQPGGAPPANGGRPGVEIHATGPLTPYQLAQFTDLCVDAVMFVDCEHRIRSWNLGAQHLFGYAPEEAIGAYYDLLLPEDLRDAQELESIGEATDAAGQVRNYVTRRMTKDGREILVSLSRTLVHDQDGALAGYGVILRDITEAERLKEELEAARYLARLGELAAQVAHEVRNPLAGISGALQILRRRLDVGPGEEEIFEALREEIDRLDRTVSDLLRFGRPAKPHKVEVSLAEWLEDWRQRHDPQATGGSTSVELVLQAQPRTELDPRLFEAVLANLLQNAQEARLDGCQVVVCVDADGRSAVVDFVDNGPGIPESRRDEVVKPFFTTKPQGSGLGLAICQRHMALMGGILEVVPSVDGGWIRLRLPRLDRELRQVSAAAS